MIGAATLAIEHGMTAKQLGLSTMAHPVRFLSFFLLLLSILTIFHLMQTVSEVIKDAALAACGMPVHS